MTYSAYNNENKKQIFVYQTSLREGTETNMPEILELIHTTNDIVLLTRAFYSLGLYLLSEESGCDKIIKCKVLYDKILIVLNCGLQSRARIALDLISALLLFGDERGYGRRQTLHMYAQDMVQTSGCLDAMCDLFPNRMMPRACALSLCRSLSAAGGAAQAQCAHLVAQCIPRCRQDNSEAFALLRILLFNNDRNIQLFHESSGMTIFTRETLRHPECLHLLSTLAENASPGNKMILNKSPEVFQILRCLLSKHGSDSSIGKWALIILYSRQKALERSPVKNDTQRDETVVPIKYNMNEKHKNPHSINETSQLFRNVYKELMLLQQHDYKINDKKIDLNRLDDIWAIEKNNTFRMNYKSKTNENNNTRGIYGDKFTSPYQISRTNDLSFSFLKKQNIDININKKTTKPINVLSNRLFKQEQPLDIIKNNKSNIKKTDLESSINNTILEFKPPFVSTPKHTNTPFITTRSSTSWSFTKQSLSIKRQDRINRKVYKTKHLIRIPLNEKKQNKSMTSKFFDLINGSCSTLVKSFTNIKNIFKRKISEEVTHEDTKGTVTIETNNNTYCSYSFTNYMQKRDAYFRDLENNTILTKELSDVTNNYCNTCNDTVVLRHKLENDKSLQQTIKKLKLAINLYGCNFKKISRTMWPRETYMTPSVLYNLYRKLIVK